MADAGWPTCGARVVKACVLQVVSHLDRRITNITQERWLFLRHSGLLCIHVWTHLELNGAETRIVNHPEAEIGNAP